MQADIRTWHSNIEQHASEGVNKILIGNKSDWTDKRAVTEEQGRELADELGIKFMETSAKVNEGVEEAFFTLARSVYPSPRSAAFLKIWVIQRHKDPPDRLTGRECTTGRIHTRFCQSQPACAAVTAGMLFINPAPLSLSSSSLLSFFVGRPIAFGFHFCLITALHTYPSICIFVRLTTSCTYPCQPVWQDLTYYTLFKFILYSDTCIINFCDGHVV